jgi:RimJ/RimL family protein N-acetyltransferase
MIAETARLRLRQIEAQDAAFFMRQVNEPSWIANIGERNIRTVADAERYFETITWPSHARFGFGMYLVERKDDGMAVGLCGLVKRDTLPDPDIGFALLEDQWGKGYAWEAASAVLQLAQDRLGIKRLLAITTPANDRSGRLLFKLGFVRQGPIRMQASEELLILYSVDLLPPDPREGASPS